MNVGSKALERQVPREVTQRHQRKKMERLRNKAVKSMQTLTETLGAIEKERRKTGKGSLLPNDYALIFDDEDLYFKMISACHSAYDQSYMSALKLFSPEYIDNIQMATISADIKMPSKRQLSNPRYRNRILKILRDKKTTSGQSYLEQTMTMTLSNKERRKQENECSLASVLFRIGYDPSDGIGNLYRETNAGKGCDDWRLCKKIRTAIRQVLKEEKDQQTREALNSKAYKP